MFDYFRYVADELNGIDGERAAQIRKERAEKEKAETFIFSKKAKLLLIILGIFFLIVSISTLAFYRETNSEKVIDVIITIVQGLVAAEVAICMIIKKDRAEIFGLVGIGLFVVMLLLSFVV